MCKNTLQLFHVLLHYLSIIFTFVYKQLHNTPFVYSLIKKLITRCWRYVSITLHKLNVNKIFLTEHINWVDVDSFMEQLAKNPIMRTQISSYQTRSNERCHKVERTENFLRPVGSSSWFLSSNQLIKTFLACQCKCKPTDSFPFQFTSSSHLASIHYVDIYLLYKATWHLLVKAKQNYGKNHKPHQRIWHKRK